MDELAIYEECRAEVLRVLARHGIQRIHVDTAKPLNREQVRNAVIRQEYAELRENGMNARAAKAEVARRHGLIVNCLSRILYS